MEVTLNVLKSDYYIDFNDPEGEIGGFIEVPVYVKDADDNPVSGSITVIYNGIQKTVNVKDGSAKVLITLPDEATTFDLTVKYDKIEQTRKVKAIDYSVLEPTTVIITMPENVTGHVLGAVSIPIQVTDGDGRPLNGKISVSYKNKQKFERVIDGLAQVTLSLPDSTQSFFVIVSMYGEEKVCKVNVVDNSVPIEEEKEIVVIEMPSKMVGHVGKNIVIPIYVHNGNNTPLTGAVMVYAVGGEHEVILQNGKSDFVFKLPDRKMEFDVIVVYNQTRETVKVRVIENTSTEPTDDNEVFIELDDISAPTGSTIHIPVYIYDSFGTRLDGEITYSYLEVSGKTDLIDGRSTVTMGLPIHPTTFVFTVNYEGVTKQIFINVVDAKNPLGNMDQVVSKENGKVVITLAKDAEGTVTVTIGGKNYTGVVENGEAVIDIDDLPDGEYDATIHYTGDDTYSPVDKPITVTIKDSDVKTDPLSDLTKVTSSGDGKIVIPFPEDATGAVNVNINGKNYVAPIENGKAIVDTSDLPEGNYNAKVNYYGDKKYPASEKTVPVTIQHDAKGDPDNPMGDLTELTSGDDGKIVIPFPDDATGPVIATINGKTYTSQVENGKAIIDASDIPAGTYNAKINYYGDAKYTASEKTVSVTVKEVVDPTNPMRDVDQITSGDDGKIVIPFPTDATGGVIVNINGKDYAGQIIDGKVVLDTKDIPAGNYTAVLKYFGDTKYSASEKNVTMIIKEVTKEPADPTNPMRDVTDIKSSDDGKVEIPFPSDATGGVKVTIDGKDYYGQIIDGKVVLDTKDIPAGNYNVTINYFGDSKYSASEKTVSVTISEVVDSKNPMGNITQTTSTDDGKVEIPLPKDATGTATVVIDGKEYPAKIVDGKIVFDTKDVPQGNYNATVKYLGDGKYSSSEKTVAMIIKEYHSSTTNNNNIIKQPVKKVKKASKITAKKMTFKAKKKVKKYSITLKSGKTPLKKVQVTIKVGKKTYKAKTKAKGKATFKINKLTKKGKYTAVIKYKGDKTYKAASKKVKITVK